MTSKEAVDIVCKKIERSEITNKSAALRAACLLPEDERIVVREQPDSSLLLSVRAEGPELAVRLCEDLLAYLNFKTKIPLEDPDRETLSASESRLRVKEKALVLGLWEQLNLERTRFSLSRPSENLELEFTDYQEAISEYKQLLKSNFFRETRAAGSTPFFTVIEPPYACSAWPAWWQATLIGGLAGAALGLLAALFMDDASGRKNVRLASQEAANSARIGRFYG